MVGVPLALTAHSCGDAGLNGLVVGEFEDIEDADPADDSGTGEKGPRYFEAKRIRGLCG